MHDYSLLFGASSTEQGSWFAYTPTPPPAGQCYPVHGAHNFFMARTETLRRYPWHPKMSIFEHEHFFFQLFLANHAVLACPHVSVFHYRAPNLHDERYMTASLRFKEAAFARHFCHAFPQLRKLYAPFWTYARRGSRAHRTGPHCIPVHGAPPLAPRHALLRRALLRRARLHTVLLAVRLHVPAHAAPHAVGAAGTTACSTSCARASRTAGSAG